MYSNANASHSYSQRGDRGDLWSTQGPSSELNGATLPSTNSYQGGIIQASGVSIVVTSGPQTVMTFTVEFDEVADPPAVTETCVDGIQNNGETGVDCGGPCAACPTTCQVSTTEPLWCNMVTCSATVYELNANNDLLSFSSVGWRKVHRCASDSTENGCALHHKHKLHCCCVLPRPVRNISGALSL
jgi:hypothetical protein